MQIHTHDPREGVLCWGGPMNGKVVPIQGTDYVIEFPMPSRPVRWDEEIPATVMMSRVRYDVEKFAVPWDSEHADEWRVLIYPENKETQKRQLEVFANFLIWLTNMLAGRGTGGGFKP